MADHPNLATFRSIYTAFSAGDMDALAVFFDEDVSWHMPGRHSPRERTTGGTPRRILVDEFDRSGGSYSVEVRDVFASDEHIVALLQGTADRDGKHLDQDYVIVFSVAEGKVRTAWEI